MLIHSKARDRRCLPFGPKTLQILQARRVRNPASEFVLGESPARLLSRISWQFRALCDRVGVGPIPLRALRHRFFERLLSTGASIESALFLGGYPRTYLNMTCFLTSYQLYEQAVRDQARVEEQQ